MKKTVAIFLSLALIVATFGINLSVQASEINSNVVTFCDFENVTNGGSYVNYGTQKVMYDSIIDVVKNYVMPSGLFTNLIPTGNAVQNMRNTIIGDNMQRDDLHLNFNYARLLASCTWFKSLLPDADLSGILTDSTCRATLNAGVQDLAALGITTTADELGNLIIECAEAAIENPYEVTVGK